MREWLNKHKNEVLVGCIATVLTSIFFDVIKWIRMDGLVAGASILAALKNYVFYEAARQTTFSLVIFIFLSLLCVYFTYILYCIIGAYHKLKILISVEEINSELDELENFTGNQTEKNDKIEKLKHKMERLKESKKNSSQGVHKKDRFKLLLYISFIAFFVVYIFCGFVIPAVLQNEFELSLTEIAPYVDEAEIKILRSKWVSMKSQEEYIFINDRIKSIKETMPDE